MAWGKDAEEGHTGVRVACRWVSLVGSIALPLKVRLDSLHKCDGRVPAQGNRRQTVVGQVGGHQGNCLEICQHRLVSFASVNLLGKGREAGTYQCSQPVEPPKSWIPRRQAATGEALVVVVVVDDALVVVEKVVKVEEALVEDEIGGEEL